jgi:hypothetical protein
MPRLLRKITHNRWELDAERRPKWLAEGEIPADPVTELKTTKNKLSVWDVGVDLDLIKRIAAAMTIQSKHLNNTFDYVLFDSELLETEGIEMERAEGATCDKDLNKRHINLKHLSAQKLVRLTDELLSKSTGIKFDRENPKTVGEYILEGISEGRLDANTIPTSIAGKLDRWFGSKWRKTNAKGMR